VVGGGGSHYHHRPQRRTIQLPLQANATQRVMVASSPVDLSELPRGLRRARRFGGLLAPKFVASTPSLLPKCDFYRCACQV
jgi:hypothetical protein